MKKLILLAFVAVMTLHSCQPDDPIPLPAKERTVLVYLIADNSLSRFAEPNLVAMMLNYKAQYGTRLIVFYNKPGGQCVLLDIEEGKTKTSDIKVLKTYPEKTNPCLPATLNEVIADVRHLTPAKQWYSMILWSHGSGWLPSGMHPAKVAPMSGEPNYLTKMVQQPQNSGASYSFGDGLYSFNTTFEMNELADALPSDITFEYIAFDACYMASVEVAYELRHKTKYFIASSAEILGAGFPYDKCMTPILTGDAKGIGREFYNHYNTQRGTYRSATIGVIDCSKLGAVAAEIATLTQSPVQLLGGQEFGRNLGLSSNYRNLFYDLSDMVHKSWGSTPAFDAAMAQAVIYQAATPMLFESDYYGQIDVISHCGLTGYLPRLSQPKTLAKYKNDYAWATDSNLGELAR